MKKLIVLLIVFISAYTFAQKTMPYKNPKLTVQKRVADLVKRLTLEEKIDLLGGTGFATKPVVRLGIPELKMTDGPVGARWNPSTAFPAGMAMAATWNPKQIEKVGEGIGREVLGKGRNVILGPCVNIARIPQGGRDFESYGEDPYLAGRMAVDYIEGVQKEGVAATVKHYAANNQEYQRGSVNVIVSERALNEIYFPAFKAAVTQADVLCVMSAYNKVNGTFCSENDYLLVDKLKKDWGFKGLVMSDWGAVHSSIPTAKSGLDLEMPTGQYLNQKTLLDAVKNGTVPLATIDDKVKRILTVIFKLGLFDKEVKENPALVNSAENRNIAYQTALESIVLLKNEQNILPLKIDNLKSIAVIGPSAAEARTGGGGSAYVTPINPVSALQGLENRLNNKVKINYSPGLKLEDTENPIESKYLFTDESLKKNGLTGEYFNNNNFEDSPTVTRVDSAIDFYWEAKSPVDGIGADNFSIRWTGVLKPPKTGAYIISVTSDDGSRLYINDQLLLNNWGQHAMLPAKTRYRFDANKIYKIKVEYNELVGDAGIKLGWEAPSKDPLEEAIDAAKNSDVALVFVGTSQNFESEGIDRPDLYLPGDQDDFIQKIIAVNPNTIVVLQTGAPVVMNRWIDKVKGIVEAWFPGTEGGNAIADVLLGNYNPSGKLPVSFPKRWEDCSAFKTYKMEDQVTRYDDGIFVGYRHFDKNNIEPLFPFGFGLSYTSFEYSNIKVTNRGKENFEVSFDVKNSGAVKGTEISELYVGQVNPKIERAVKELKGFNRVELNPGETSHVKLVLDKNAFTYYDESTHVWKVDPGQYQIMIGSSSRDIQLKQTVDVK